MIQFRRCRRTPSAKFRTDPKAWNGPFSGSRLLEGWFKEKPTVSHPFLRVPQNDRCPSPGLFENPFVLVPVPSGTHRSKMTEFGV